MPFLEICFSTSFVGSLTSLVAETIYSRGLSITIAGLVIVFAALTLLTLFIAAMPRMLRVLDRILPEIDHSGHDRGHPESQVADDEILAAIGFVLHCEFQKQISSGDTVHHPLGKVAAKNN